MRLYYDDSFLWAAIKQYEFLLLFITFTWKYYDAFYNSFY